MAMCFANTLLSLQLLERMLIIGVSQKFI